MYNTRQINDYTWMITDHDNDAIYVIAGNERAMVIDSGMDHDPLMPIVRSLTDKPPFLVLTHGHIDHIGRSGEFDEVYLDQNDFEVYREHTHLDMGKFQSEGLPFRDPDALKVMPESFDLGGITIDVMPLYGHTPGSVVFIDYNDNNVFTGDAVGSGCGVWVQLPESYSTSQYRDSLHEALKAFEELGIDDSWNMYGGHAEQEYMSRVSEYNPLCTSLIKDMEILCMKMLDDEVELSPIPSLSNFGDVQYAAYGRAEIVARKDNIK